MRKQVKCDKCGTEIKTGKDLVVTTYFLPFILRKYHNSCYAQLEKSGKGFFFLGGKPVNSNVNTVVVIAGSILLLLFVFATSKNSLITALAVLIEIVLLYPRIASYYRYEKPLKTAK